MDPTADIREFLTSRRASRVPRLEPLRRADRRPPRAASAARRGMPLQFVGFTAEPGSTSDDALRLLGSLSAPAAETSKREV